MDRPASTPASAATAFGRLVLVALPLIVLGVLRLAPAGPMPAWGPSAASIMAAALSAVATIWVVAEALRRGRLGRFVDASALGALTVTCAVLAIHAALLPGLAVGLAIVAPLGLLAAAWNGPRLDTGLPRAAAAVVAFLLIEACLGAVLVAQTASTPAPAPGLGPTETLLSAGAAGLFAAAALFSLRRPLRATALGLAAAAAGVLLLARPDSLEPLVAVLAMAATPPLLVAAVQRDPGNGHVVPRRSRTQDRAPAAQPPAPALLPDPTLESELDAGRRLTRELRATIDELAQARHTVALQRTEIERLASVDPLTGVRPRPQILERLRTETAETHRYSHPFALALIDLDALGEINQRHGREVGDQILREVALRIRIRTRVADAIGRVDGDAFLAILPHTDERGATVFADAVRRLVAERPMATDVGELTATVSIGVAIMRPGMTLTDDDLLGVVGEALAAAKAGGGNRIAFDRAHGFVRIEERPTDATSDAATDATPETPEPAPEPHPEVDADPTR